MKKLAIAMMLGIAAMSASAQVNYKMQVACSPQDVKTYDTNRLRSSFLMEKVMVPNEINLTYSMYDRLIFGGAVPATKELVLLSLQWNWQAVLIFHWTISCWVQNALTRNASFKP